jgi:hypothetical protein
MGFLRTTCGVIVAEIGTWSGYRNARDAIAPTGRQGDPSRSAIDAARPLYARIAVRRFARSAVFAVGWLVLALYGLSLASSVSLVGRLA